MDLIFVDCPSLLIQLVVVIFHSRIRVLEVLKQRGRQQSLLAAEDYGIPHVNKEQFEVAVLYRLGNKRSREFKSSVTNLITYRQLLSSCMQTLRFSIQCSRFTAPYIRTAKSTILDTSASHTIAKLLHLNAHFHYKAALADNPIRINCLHTV